MKKKAIFLLFVLVLFTSCSKKVEDCKFSPDLERIGESAVENIENLAETNLKSGKMICNF
tara:strand:- start:140 stop:319 length:180 start_codon:yes stop_codon:yes gene_type:complete